MEKVDLCLPSAKFSSQHSSAKRFSRIYARDRLFVRSVLLKFGIPVRDVDDLVQNVFVVLWQRFDALANIDDLRSWLYVVALNLARNYRSRHGTWREWLVGEMPEQQVVLPDMELRLDAYRALMRMTLRMRANVREVFVQVVMEGQTQVEVARVMATSPKTVQSRMRVVRDVMVRAA